MSYRKLFGLVLVGVLVAVCGMPVGAQEPPHEPLRVLSADVSSSTGERDTLVEWWAPGFEIEPVERAGETCQRVILPGTVQTTVPGAPQVPMRGALLGLPPAADTASVAVRIVQAEWESLGRYRLCPAPVLRLEGDDEETGILVESAAPDPEMYTRDALFPRDALVPHRPVELGTVGFLRDQAVAQVQFNPVQYNPVTGEARLYRRIVARVTWETLPSGGAQETRWASSAYEGLLASALLNYGTLNRPPPAPSEWRPSPVRHQNGGTGEGEESSPRTANTLPPPRKPGGIEGGRPETTQVVTMSGAAFKVGITEDGLYQLTYNDLTGAGFSLSGVDPRTLKLSVQGVELPIWVTGAEDGRFDAGDLLLFYGVANDDVYTKENVYWLTAGGSNGRRMRTRDGTPSGSAPVPAHFPTTLHAEQDTYYWVTMPDGEGQDHWFWQDKITAPGSCDYVLALHNLSPTTTTATLRVRLKGHTATGTTPDHHTRLRLNGVQIDDRTWDGFAVYDHQATVAHSRLAEGTNTLRVEGAGDTGASVDQFFVNWIEVDYWHTYVAEDDALFFRAPQAGTYQFEVTGYSGAAVDVLDVSDPADVVRFTNTSVVADGGAFRVRFEDAAQATTRYLALTPARRRTPARLELDQPSNWRSPANGADYILIAHEDFMASAQRLADHRSALGLRVALVWVEDLYDEFNGGVFHPRAIRDFLSYAYHHWMAPAPTYVTLLGGASYDYRDLLDLDRANYVPTQMIETETLGQTPSDNWFVLLNGDDVLPDMLIGRLTAQSAAEAADAVDKVLAYEAHPVDAAWNTRTLFVGDDEPAFESMLDDLAGRLPHYYTATRVYAGDYPPGDPRADTIEAINNGTLLVQYAGHGNVDRWGSWSGGALLLRSDVSGLRNDDRLPLVSLANCLNGYFNGKNISLAEEFLKQDDRGAAAVWAPTGMGYPSGHRVLMGAFYDAVFQDDIYLLGAATTAAKVEAYAQSPFWADLVETYVLLGDPVTPLGIPANYPYLERTVPADGETGVPTEQEIVVRFSKPMDPATVALSVEGAEGLALTPSWNEERTEVTYSHSGLARGRTLTLTVSGQDRLGNPLGAGLVPGTWTFRTVPGAIVGLERVWLDGPATGTAHTPYTVRASVSPLTATLPVTYHWQATGHAPQTYAGGLEATATYTWGIPGAVTLVVSATNAAGEVVADVHTANILPAPVTGVSASGPARAAIDTRYTFEASARPPTATLPLTYTWQATDQASRTRTGGLSDAVTYTWAVPGLKTVTATVTNAAGGAVVDTHAVEVLSVVVHLTGPSQGAAHNAYTFEANVRPSHATEPVAYLWQATGQAAQTHESGLHDAATYTWDTPGHKTVTVAATNAEGAFTDTHDVWIGVRPSAVDVAGPPTSTVGVPETFTASVVPLSATTPITYVWQVTGQAGGAFPLTRVGGLRDTLSVTWSTSGMHSVSVAAWNVAGAVTDSRLVTVNDPLPERYYLYLPLVVKQ